MVELALRGRLAKLPRKFGGHATNGKGNLNLLGDLENFSRQGPKAKALVSIQSMKTMK